MNNKFEKSDCCSFCGKSESAVKRLVAGPNGVFICDDCVVVCGEIIREHEFDNEPDISELPTPATMKRQLDDYIVGQDDAKRMLSVAVYNHYKRINHNAKAGLNRGKKEQDDVELEKSNILMLGPTGCGKTLIAKTMAKILNVPFAVADATTLTEAGYVGEDVENILLRLIQAADFDIKRAERGIIYIDELDKIARKSENTSITRDVSGEGVQQALLKIVESTVASVPPQGGRKHPHQECIQIDTTNILFIFGGAFVGLDKIIEKRKSTASMGFSGTLNTKADTVGLLREVQPHDLIKFGIIPEFVGRIPAVVSLDSLDESALVSIMTKPKNALTKQYKKLFMLDGVVLEFDDDAVTEVAKRAIKLETGARGLRSILEEAMLGIMYDIPDDKTIATVRITADVINRCGKPVILRKSQSDDCTKVS